MIITIITRGRCRNREVTSLNKTGKDETVYLADKLNELFSKSVLAKFYTSESNADQITSIMFARRYNNCDMIDYSISTIKNDLNKEKIAVKGCFSEFRNGDIHVDGDKISALLLYLEDEKIERVFIFVSSDRAQQWVTAIIGKQSERLPESSAAVIDTAFPNMVRYYGLQLELLKSQRDESHQQFEDAMKALNLIKRKL